MSLNYPIYPTVSPRIGETLSKDHSSPAPNKVPWLQRASGRGRGGSRTRIKQRWVTSLMISSSLPFWSIFSHPYYCSPAPFCHYCSSFIWTSRPSTKMRPRGNYKMEDRSQAAPLSNIFSQRCTSSFPLWQHLYNTKWDRDTLNFNYTQWKMNMFPIR